MKSSLLHRVLTSLRFRARQWHIGRAGLTWSTESKVKIRIRNSTDWTIFNEVFAGGEYDLAITKLLERHDRSTLQVLDLGANVGFFTLRLAHLAREGQYAGHLSIKAIEGSPQTYLWLTNNLAEQDFGPRLRIDALHGLIGEKRGIGVIYLYAMHGLNSMIARTSKTARVPFIDMDEITSGWESIDLIKCDIEESELSFIRNYSDLLKKTKALICELHYDQAMRDESVRLLGESGLVHRKVVHQRSHSSVEYFWR